MAGAPSTPAFSLASGHVYTTHERPSIDLTYRGVTQLDFRHYYVGLPRQTMVWHIEQIWGHNLDGGVSGPLHANQGAGHCRYKDTT